MKPPHLCSSLLLLLAACVPTKGAGARAPEAQPDKVPQSPSPSNPSPSPTPSAAQHDSDLDRKPHPPRPKAVSGLAFTTPPPWPETWCIDHAAVWGPELESRHALAENSSSYGPGCSWSWESAEGERSLGVGITAGSVGGKFAAVQRPKAGLDPSLGTEVIVHTNGNQVVLRLWNDAPPFQLSASSKGFNEAEGKRRTHALARDVLASIDRDEFRRPKAELVFIYPNFPDHAQAVLQRWAQLAPIFDATVPLPAGFPKLVSVDDFEWDPGKRPDEDWRWEQDGSAPPSQLLLMAICPAGAGQRVVEMANGAFAPFGKYVAPVAAYVADAEGLTIECPKAALTEPGNPMASFAWPQPDGTTLRAVTATDADASPGTAAFYGAFFLTDADGTPLDYQPFELRKPKEPNGMTHAGGHGGRIGKCKADLDPEGSNEPKARLVCEIFRNDQRCRIQEHVGAELHFFAQEGEVRVEELPVEYPGRDCTTSPVGSKRPSDGRR